MQKTVSKNSSYLCTEVTSGSAQLKGFLEAERVALLSRLLLPTLLGEVQQQE